MAIAPLDELDDWQLENEEQDIEGWPVIDATGAELGRVTDLIVDTEQERVVEIVTDSGGRYDPHDVEIREDVVVLQTISGVADAETGASMRPIASDATAETESIPGGEMSGGQMQGRPRIRYVPLDHRLPPDPLTSPDHQLEP